MGAAEVRRHQVGVVEVGERRVGVGGAGVEDGLGERVEQGEVGVPWRKREGVVDEANGVAVVALETSTDVAEPRHVHGRGQQREVAQGGVLKDTHEIARDHRRLQPADGRVLAPLGTDLRDHQERRCRQDVRLEEGRCVGERQCLFPAAAKPVGPDGGHALPHSRHGAQILRGTVLERQDPAFRAAQELAGPHIRPQPAARARFLRQKLSSLPVGEDEVSAVNRL